MKTGAIPGRNGRGGKKEKKGYRACKKRQVTKRVSRGLLSDQSKGIDADGNVRGKNGRENTQHTPGTRGTARFKGKGASPKNKNGRKKIPVREQGRAGVKRNFWPPPGGGK